MHPFFADYVERMEALHRDFIAVFDDLPAEALDWLPGEDTNSLCVLVVHTAGAGRFWIGDVALGENSNRNRTAEFEASGLTHDELKAHFADLEAYMRDALERISLDDLAEMRSAPRSDGTLRHMTAGWALLHALEHTGMHLGHAQLTRQLWQQSQKG